MTATEKHRVTRSEEYPVYYLDPDIGQWVDLPAGFAERYDAAWGEWKAVQAILSAALGDIT